MIVTSRLRRGCKMSGGIPDETADEKLLRVCFTRGDNIGVVRGLVVHYGADVHYNEGDDQWSNYLDNTPVMRQ